jgi:hypothetical protein
VISQPSLHFFGNTTPSGLWGALASEAAVGGLLGRCLLFESDALALSQGPCGQPRPDAALSGPSRRFTPAFPGHALPGNLGRGSAVASPAPYMVPWATRDAAEFYKQLGIHRD